MTPTINGHDIALDGAGRRARRPTLIAIGVAGIWGLSVASLATGILTAPSTGPQAPSIENLLPVSLAVLLPITVGAILAVRLPGNRIGWLLLLSGLTLGVNLGASGLVSLAPDGTPGSLPGAAWLAVLAQITFLPFVVGLGVFVPLLYPSGSLPSRRWRPVALLGLLALACGTIKNLLVPFPPDTYPQTVQNPLQVTGSAADLVSLLDIATTLIGVLALPLVAASLVIRYRRAAGVERQQLKWFAYVGAISVPALVVGIVLSSETTGILGAISSVAWLTGLTGFALLPVAIGVAILRYRLYDIDLIINRTIVYGLLTAILAGSYAAIVGLMQRFFVALTGSGSDAAVVVTTLVVVSLFSPVKNRLQSLVDRRFKETGDRGKLLLDFAAAVEARLAPIDGALALTRLLGTAGKALGARSGSVWLGSGEGARLVATLSPEPHSEADAPPAATDGTGLDVACGTEPGVRLVLGPRARSAPYGEPDRSAVEVALTAVSVALREDSTTEVRTLSPSSGTEATRPARKQGARGRRAGVPRPEAFELDPLNPPPS